MRLKIHPQSEWVLTERGLAVVIKAAHRLGEPTRAVVVIVCLSWLHKTQALSEFFCYDFVQQITTGSFLLSLLLAAALQLRFTLFLLSVTGKTYAGWDPFISHFHGLSAVTGWTIEMMNDTMTLRCDWVIGDIERVVTTAAERKLHHIPALYHPFLSVQWSVHF